MIGDDAEQGYPNGAHSHAKAQQQPRSETDVVRQEPLSKNHRGGERRDQRSPGNKGQQGNEQVALDMQKGVHRDQGDDHRYQKPVASAKTIGKGPAQHCPRGTGNQEGADQVFRCGKTG